MAFRRSSGIFLGIAATVGILPEAFASAAPAQADAEDLSTDLPDVDAVFADVDSTVDAFKQQSEQMQNHAMALQAASRSKLEQQRIDYEQDLALIRSNISEVQAANEVSKNRVRDMKKSSGVVRREAQQLMDSNAVMRAGFEDLASNLTRAMGYLELDTQTMEVAGNASKLVEDPKLDPSLQNFLEVVHDHTPSSRLSLLEVASGSHPLLKHVAMPGMVNDMSAKLSDLQDAHGTSELALQAYFMAQKEAADREHSAALQQQAALAKNIKEVVEEQSSLYAARGYLASKNQDLVNRIGAVKLFIHNQKKAVHAAFADASADLSGTANGTMLEEESNVSSMDSEEGNIRGVSLLQLASSLRGADSAEESQDLDMSLPDVDFLMNDAVTSVSDFTQQADLVRRSAEESQRRSEEELATRKSEFEQRLKDLLKVRADMQAATAMTKQKIAGIEKSNKLVMREIRSQEERNTVYREALADARMKLGKAADFLNATIVDTNTTGAKQLKALEPKPFNATLEHFLGVMDKDRQQTPPVFLQLRSSVHAKLKSSAASKPAMTSNATEQGSPRSRAGSAEEVVPVLQRGFQKLEKAQEEGGFKMEASFVAREQIENATNMRENAEREHQEALLAEVMQQQVDLHNARLFLSQRGADLRERIRSLQVFANTSRSLIATTIVQARQARPEARPAVELVAVGNVSHQQP